MKQHILRTATAITLLVFALSAFGQENQENNNSQNNEPPVDHDYYHPNNDPNLDKGLSNDPSKTEGGIPKQSEEEKQKIPTWVTPNN